MAIHTLNKSRATTIEMQTDDETWIIGKNGVISKPDIGIDAGGPASGRKVVVNGEIHATQTAVDFGDQTALGGGEIIIGKSGLLQSDDTAIISRGNGQIITNDGSIQAVEGIESNGRNVRFTNNGDITVSNDGFIINEGSGRIVNTGTIAAEAGIFVSNKTNLVIENSGLITGTKLAVEFQGLGKHEIHNTGTMKGDLRFDADSNDFLENTGKGVIKDGDIDLGGGNDHVVNSGRMLGKLALGAGNDVADLRGSKAIGPVYGEQGNDVYIIDDVKQQVFENAGEGKDTIRSAISYSLAGVLNGEIENLVGLGHGNLSLTGDDIANRVVGNRGANHLDGGMGNDVLVGGKGADVFIFATGGGQDTIKDFVNGEDKIDVSGWAGIDNIQDVKAHLTVNGDDLVLMNGTDQITFLHTDISEINKGDFIF